jgi:hypothetical protein
MAIVGFIIAVAFAVAAGIALYHLMGMWVLIIPVVLWVARELIYLVWGTGSLLITAARRLNSRTRAWMRTIRVGCLVGVTAPRVIICARSSA